MILCGTGHRPDKLGGYDNETAEILASFAIGKLRELSPKLVISGMALGWDQALARAAAYLGIPFHAYVPFVGMEDRWPKDSQLQYHGLMTLAEKVVYCSGDGYAVWKMQARNERMVQDSELVLALWNGSSGGTSNCIGYANKMKRPVLNVWKDWEKFSDV